MRKPVVTILCFGVLVSALAGCSSLQDSETNSIDDISLFTGEPCEAPCWYGITPGETTLEQVREILPTLEFVDKDNIDEDRATYPGWTIFWVSIRDEDEHGFVSFDDAGRVNNITHYWGTEITLQSLIDLKGEPDGLLPIWHPNDPKIHAEIIWFSQGFSVSVETKVVPSEWDVLAPVEPDAMVNQATYVSVAPDAETAFGGSVPEDFYEWNGYQPVK